MENTKEKEKSRAQTIVEYYEALQIEYIVAELRHRIYIETGDKRFYEKLMFGKYETINEISTKHSLPSIFTDQDYKTDLQRRVYRDDNHPCFIYKDFDQRRQQEPLDLTYYYYPGSDIRCTINEETYLGKIVSYTPFGSIITVTVNEKEQVLQIGQVIRIL